MEAAREAGALAIFLASPREAGEWLKAELRPGDAVLLKASRGVGLEQALRLFASTTTYDPRSDGMLLLHASHRSRMRRSMTLVAAVVRARNATRMTMPRERL